MAKDTCVMCGEITPYDFETNIHLRYGYVEGMGQLCQSCYNGEKNDDTLIIPKKIVSHNTKIDNLFDYTGVLYRSNLDKNYTDLNPSWVFDIFKEKLEEL